MELLGVDLILNFKLDYYQSQGGSKTRLSATSGSAA
jgi:hypothetical protein